MNVWLVYSWWSGSHDSQSGWASDLIGVAETLEQARQIAEDHGASELIEAELRPLGAILEEPIEKVTLYKAEP